MTYFVKEVRRAGNTVSVITVQVSKGYAADDGETFSLGFEFWKKLGICEGDTVSEDGYFIIGDAAKKSEAVSKALDVLSYSNHSRNSLETRLRLKCRIEKEYAVFAADYCVEHGYVDEARQAEKIAERVARTKLWGKRRIAQELYSKGYPKNIAVSAPCSVSDEEYAEILKKAILKKTDEYPCDYSEKSKLVAAVSRLGHAPKDVENALEQVFKE